jgi:anti-sigma regulatory factor (Ser/Thr protein kinase)
LVLAVSEAGANAIQHSGTDAVVVAWESRDGRIDVEVRDRGLFRRRVPMPEVEGVGGHGVPLMMALVDELSIREGTPERPGTVVRLTVHVASSRAAG